MKLKANELRLGNLVYYKNQIVEVPRIDCNTDNVNGIKHQQFVTTIL